MFVTPGAYKYQRCPRFGRDWIIRRDENVWPVASNLLRTSGESASNTKCFPAFPTLPKLQPKYSVAHFRICSLFVVALSCHASRNGFLVLFCNGVCGIPSEAIHNAPSTGVGNSPLASGPTRTGSWAATLCCTTAGVAATAGAVTGSMTGTDAG